MPAVLNTATILLTGANGLLGAELAKQLLERGFTVRGSVRTDSKGQYLKRLFNDHGDRFEYIVIPDLTAPDAYDKVLENVSAVIHQASFMPKKLDHVDDFLRPNVEGTKVLLNSIKAHSPPIKRLVLTASNANAWESVPGPYVWTEADWNETSIKLLREKGIESGIMNVYAASKTLQEKLLWEFANDNKDNISFDAVAILPGLIIGPSICESEGPSPPTSLVIPWAILTGQDLPFPPAPAVDVRDVADLHVRSLLVEKAGGQRLLAVPYPANVQDILDAVHALKPDPTDVPIGTPGSSKNEVPEKRFDSSKSMEVLDFKYREAAEVYQDTYRSLVERGFIKA